MIAEGRIHGRAITIFLRCRGIGVIEERSGFYEAVFATIWTKLFRLLDLKVALLKDSSNR